MSNFIKDTDHIFFCVMTPIIDIIGVILSITGLAILQNVQFKENVYKYLKVETLFICINLIISSLRPMYHCETVSTYKTKLIVIFQSYFRGYFGSCLEEAAFLCNLIATFQFYLMVANVKSSKFKRFARFNYKIVCFIVFLFSCVLFLYQIFEFKIVSHMNNDNKTIYTTESINIEYHYLFNINRIVAFSIRDFLNPFISIILNILIYLKVRRVIKRKKTLQKNKTTNMKNVDNSLKLMIFFGSLNNIVGRVPIALWYILDIFYNYEKTHLVLKFAVLAVDLSYAFHFILYYVTNKLFRQIFVNYLFNFCRRN
jgi:hypothetical protein